jgi:hypothetical protein
LEFLVTGFLHGNLCPLGILAEEHLDESVALVLVDDASLHLPVAAEDLAEFVI